MGAGHGTLLVLHGNSPSWHGVCSLEGREVVMKSTDAAKKPDIVQMLEHEEAVYGEPCTPSVALCFIGRR